MGKQSRPRGRWVRKDDRLFVLEVSLIGGPIMEAFAEKNPVVSRTIEIRGDQTLEKLHYAIFGAFDREEQHLYEFQVGGRAPNDPKARRYGLPEERFGPLADEQEGFVDSTSIGSIGLEVGDVFGYWFDFGDDWWHQIDVRAIREKAPPGDYPRITERQGESPAQYPNWDEEE